MVKESCPLAWGDRVSHKLFGFGTVNGEPIAMMRGDMRHGTVPAGWSVPVEWDDSTRTAGKVGHSALEKVSTPDAKGAHYWHHQWKRLLDACTAARRDNEVLLSNSFRTTPPFSEADFKAKLEAEREAIDDLLQFLRDDAAGEHK